MITAAKLKQLTSITADQLTEMMLEDGCDCSDEPFINTHFKGMELDSDFSIINGGNINFFYEAQYVHVDGGLQFARVIVAYNSFADTMSADYEG